MWALLDFATLLLRRVLAALADAIRRHHAARTPQRDHDLSRYLFEPNAERMLEIYGEVIASRKLQPAR